MATAFPMRFKTIFNTCQELIESSLSISPNALRTYRTSTIKPSLAVLVVLPATWLKGEVLIGNLDVLRVPEGTRRQADSEVLYLIWFRIEDLESSPCLYLCVFAEEKHLCALISVLRALGVYDSVYVQFGQEAKMLIEACLFDPVVSVLYAVRFGLWFGSRISCRRILLAVVLATRV